MSKSVLPFQYRRRLFVYSLGIIIAVISFFETMIMFLFEALPGWGIKLESLQETAIDTGLLALLSAPCLWWFSLRPLALDIESEQFKFQEQARLNAELLSALDIHALVSITDIRGRIIHANDKFCQTSGYTREELVGKDHRIVNSGWHDKSYIRNLWDTIRSGQVWQGEFCNRGKDGSYYWVDNTIMPLLNNVGKPRQYISVRRDITTQKNNELKLIALRRAVDASSDMVVLTDGKGYMQYVNSALCKFTGWSESELLDQHVNILDNPDEDQNSFNNMKNALKKNESWFGRISMRRRIQVTSEHTHQEFAHFQNFWAELCVTPILDKDNMLFGYVQIQRDVSAQIAREAIVQIEKQDSIARINITEVLQQIKPMEQRFIQALKLLLDLNGFNGKRKGGVLLKIDGEDYLDTFVLQGDFDEAFLLRLHHMPVDGYLCGSTRLSVEQLVFDICCCGPDNDGALGDQEQRHGHYLVPLLYGGEYLGVLFLFTDHDPQETDTRNTMLIQVGEMMALALLQEKAKVSLETSRDAAVQAARTKSEFLANMSHEIRTPMNGVLGMLDLLKDTELSHEQTDLLETAAHSAESLLTIINDILDYSKLEADKIELEKFEFDLPVLVEEVCTLMATRAHAKDLEVNCFIPANLPQRWLGDPTRIRQVLTNLIGNAVKFTQKGEVSVSISVMESNEDSAALRFDIRDTGIGIALETQLRLFQPFSQADSSTSRCFGGTGLGLSISRDLVKLMGGAIGLDSVLGQGTNFWFTLPLTPLYNIVQTQPPDLCGQRVLVVDDNATNRIILEHYLLNWGLTVVQVDNAASALDELLSATARGEPYSLLISDLHMPQMDGYALMRAINENPAIASIPRLLLSSGRLSSEAERKAMRISQSLLKPVRRVHLYDAINNALKANNRVLQYIEKQTNVLPDYANKRVLIAEDNKVNQKVITALLTRLHIYPDIVENGQEVLNRLQQDSYDLILMDCQMPVMDGYETTQQVRVLEISQNLAHIPIVALTAHAATDERQRCLSAGMDDFLAKPIVRDKLLALLSRWLGNADAQSATEQESEIQEEIAPIIWDEAEVLKNLDNDDELLTEIIALFLDEVPKKLVALDEATSAQHTDLKLVSDIAHALKGMVGHFCIKPIMNVTEKLEEAARNNNLADIAELTHELMGSMKNLLENLRNRKGHIHG
ncbi:MAG: response regulator [Methylococcaceae bacterium]|nr:response regulator [Methylococcaceae bacterium]